MLNIHFHNVAMQCVKYLIHTFCVYLFFVVLGGAVIELALNCVLVHDKHRFYVGSVG